jgi:hypothetical protein
MLVLLGIGDIGATIDSKTMNGFFADFAVSNR